MIKPTMDCGNAAEWSTDTTGSLDDKKPSKLFVTIDEDSTLLTVEHCFTTSRRDSAQRLADGHKVYMTLTTEEARWLIDALTSALSEQESRGFV